MKFEEMEINLEIIEILKEENIEEMTEIQRLAIPAIMEGNDMVAQSETGSGKTLAFAIPLVEKINGSGLKAVIITPTRELANQIEREIKKIASYKKLNIANIHGGVPIAPQIKKLGYANIMVATPGRMLDHMRRRTIDLSHVEYVVIDEADRMLDMGFIDDVEKILWEMPEGKQIMMFSATIPNEIKKILFRYMKNAKIIITKKLVDPSLLNQYYVEVRDENKIKTLAEIIRKEKIGRALIFTNTRIKAKIVAENLEKRGIKAKEIHGGLNQAKRDNVMHYFRKGRINILVATDVASRGIDIKEITHVFNYDVPKNPEDYIHRIGRTARAGKEGKAITMLSPPDHANLRKIIRKFEITITRMR